MGKKSVIHVKKELQGGHERGHAAVKDPCALAVCGSLVLCTRMSSLQIPVSTSRGIG